jgi:hypothetical protein
MDVKTRRDASASGSAPYHQRHGRRKAAVKAAVDVAVQPAG